MSELRCYTFTLYQLSSIQQGIQAGHAAVELVNMHGTNAMVREWASKWKTLVLLNGGDLADLKETLFFFAQAANTLQWAVFYESQESLGNLPTSIAVVVPDRIFLAAEALRKAEPVDLRVFSFWEQQFVERLRTTPLAR